MSNTAENAGVTVWIDPKTRNAICPVRREYDRNGKRMSGVLDRVTSCIVLIAYLGMIGVTGWVSYRPVPRMAPEAAFMASALKPVLFVIVIGGGIALALNTALRAERLAIRVVVSMAIIGGAIYFKLSEGVMTVVGCLVFLVTLGWYRDANTFNARMASQGLQETTLPEMPGTFPHQLPLPVETPAIEVADQNVASSVEVKDDTSDAGYFDIGLPPKLDYSGRWGDLQFMNGEVIGLWKQKSLRPEFPVINWPFTQDSTHSFWSVYASLRLFEIPKYPHGYVLDPTLGEIVPRQHNIYESPASRPFEPGPASDAYGSNRPRSTDELTRDGAARPWPGGTP